jgi:hypothetical protein
MLALNPTLPKYFDKGKGIGLTLPKNLVMVGIFSYHYDKKGCYAIDLAIQILRSTKHLQFSAFIHCEC